MPQLKAVIFGAIGTIAETSDIQRQAFNAAFDDAGLPWLWTTEIYHDLLKINGGQNRIRAYRDAQQATLPDEMTDEMITALHAAKTEHYVTMLRQVRLQPRPGVVELIDACERATIRVALCTSTSADNVNALSVALANQLAFSRFAAIVTIEQLSQPKPAPDAYRYCLKQLDLSANEVIAIEDSPASVTAAQAVGIKTLATPGAMTANQDFAAANWVMPNLTSMTIPRLAALLETQTPLRQLAQLS